MGTARMKYHLLRLNLFIQASSTLGLCKAWAAPTLFAWMLGLHATFGRHGSQERNSRAGRNGGAGARRCVLVGWPYRIGAHCSI